MSGLLSSSDDENPFEDDSAQIKKEKSKKNRAVTTITTTDAGGHLATPPPSSVTELRKNNNKLNDLLTPTRNQTNGSSSSELSELSSSPSSSSIEILEETIAIAERQFRYGEHKKNSTSTRNAANRSHSSGVKNLNQMQWNWKSQVPINKRPKRVKTNGYQQNSDSDYDADGDELMSLLGGNEEITIMERLHKMKQAEEEILAIERRKESTKLRQELEEEAIRHRLYERCGRLPGMTVPDVDKLIELVIDHYRENVFNSTTVLPKVLDEKALSSSSLSPRPWGTLDIHIFQYLGDRFYNDQKEKREKRMMRLSRGGVGSEAKLLSLLKRPLARRSLISSGWLFSRMTIEHDNIELSDHFTEFLTRELAVEDNEQTLDELLDILIRSKIQRSEKSDSGSSDTSEWLISISYMEELLISVGGSHISKLIHEKETPIDFESLTEEVIPDFNLPTAMVITKIIDRSASALMVSIKPSSNDAMISTTGSSRSCSEGVGNDNVIGGDLAAGTSGATACSLHICLRVLRLILIVAADVTLEQMGVDSISKPLAKVFKCIASLDWPTNVQTVVETIFTTLTDHRARLRLLNYMQRAIVIAEPSVGRNIHNLRHQLSTAFFLNSTLFEYDMYEVYSNNVTDGEDSSKSKIQDNLNSDTFLEHVILPYLSADSLLADGDVSFLNDPELIMQKAHQFSFLAQTLFHQLPQLFCERGRETHRFQIRQQITSHLNRALKLLRPKLIREDIVTLYVAIEVCYNTIQGTYSTNISIL